MKSIISTFLKSLGLAAIIYAFQAWLGGEWLIGFLRANLITILVTLLAINTATTAVILTKMSEISRQHGRPVNDIFAATKQQMKLSFQEQIGLIAAGMVLSVVSTNKGYVFESPVVNISLEILLATVFIYALFLLYDTAVATLEFYQ